MDEDSLEELMRLIRLDFADGVRAALDAGVSPNRRSASGASLLGEAVRARSADVVRLLLGRGARIPPRSDRGGRPFLADALFGSPEPDAAIIEMLLEAGARPPLELLERGPSLLSVLLRWALAQAGGERDGAALVLGVTRAHFDSFECRVAQEPLLQAILSGAENDVERALAKAGGGVDDPGVTDGLTPLLAAVDALRPAIVQRLLEAGADPNHPDLRRRLPLRSALHTRQHHAGEAGASLDEVRRIVELLLDHGAIFWRGSKQEGHNIRVAMGEYPDVLVRWALGKDDGDSRSAAKRLRLTSRQWKELVESADRLEQHRLPMVAPGSTLGTRPMPTSADYARKTRTEHILSSEPLEARQNPTASPRVDEQIVAAAAHGDNDTLALLWGQVRDIADVRTILATAEEAGHLGTVRWILEQPRSDPAEVAVIREAAAFAAAAYGDESLLEAILADGCDPCSHDGYSLLHVAAMHGHPRLVRLLLAYGADATAKSDDGETIASRVADLAEGSGKAARASEIRTLLRSARRAAKGRSSNDRQ